MRKVKNQHDLGDFIQPEPCVGDLKIVTVRLPVHPASADSPQTCAGSAILYSTPGPRSSAGGTEESLIHSVKYQLMLFAFTLAPGLADDLVASLEITLLLPLMSEVTQS